MAFLFGSRSVNILTEQIRKTLDYTDSCTIYRPDLARVWPKVIDMREERDAAIQEFARERGWTATIVDPGITVTFRKAAAFPH